MGCSDHLVATSAPYVRGEPRRRQARIGAYPTALAAVQGAPLRGTAAQEREACPGWEGRRRCPCQSSTSTESRGGSPPLHRLLLPASLIIGIGASTTDDQRGSAGMVHDSVETLPSSIDRRPVSPRDPVTIAVASRRSAVSTIAFQTAPGASTVIDSARRPAFRASCAPTSASRRASPAAVESSPMKSTELADISDHAIPSVRSVGCHAVATTAGGRRTSARALNRVPGVRRPVIAQQHGPVRAGSEARGSTA